MSRRHRSEGTVTQKRGLWYAILNISRDQPRQRVRQWSKGFKTKREAERALAEMLLQGRRAKNTKATVADVVSRYIEQDVTPRGQRSLTTTQRYKGLLGNMEPLHHRVVDHLDGSAIEEFYLDLLKSLSHTTVHHVHNLMFAAFRWAARRKVGLITRNPLEADDVDRPRRAKSKAQSFTVEQAQRGLKALAKTKHSNALIFTLATGCRRGESCGLKWTAVDFVRKVAIFRESRYQVGRITGQKTTKADRIREVPLNQTALRALKAEHERQLRRKAFAGDAWSESGHVFTDELGAPLSPMALTNAFARCARAAELPTTAMHDLRHTAATFILSAGGNPAAAAQILGHSEKSTTLRLYGHVIGLDEVRAARSIDKALNKKPRHSESESATRVNGEGRRSAFAALKSQITALTEHEREEVFHLLEATAARAYEAIS